MVGEQGFDLGNLPRRRQPAHNTGCVFEEIYTTHFNDDSYYQDKKINKMKHSERKAIVDQWGRFENANHFAGTRA